jgi:hypothetical protein
MGVSHKFLKFKPRGLKHLKGKGIEDILAHVKGVEDSARDFVKSELKRPLKFKR